MVRQRIGRGIVFHVAFCVWYVLLGMVSVVNAVVLEPRFPQFEFAAQDRFGTVWAVAPDQENRIYAFDENGWQSIAQGVSTSEDGARPLRLILRADGEVACLWVSRDGAFAVTIHSGKKSKQLAKGHCKGIPEGRVIRLFSDSKNRIWLTGFGADILRFDPDGRVSHGIQLTASDWGAANAGTVGINPLEIVEDGKGRIWIWNSTLKCTPKRLSLKGPLILDEGVLTRPEIQKDKLGLFSNLALKDADEMWVTVEGGGLFRMNASTFALAQVSEPAQEAFNWIDDVFTLEGNTYVMEGLRATGGSLWRLKGDKWERVLAQLNGTENDGVRSMVWISFFGGLLFSKPRHTFWFLDAKGDAALLDWKCGFPLLAPSHLFRLNNGFLLAFSGDEVFQGPLKLPMRRNISPRVVELESTEDRQNESARQLGLRDRQYNVPFPPNDLKMGESHSRVIDNQGTLWMTNQRQLYKARGEKWVQVFDEGENHPFQDGRSLIEAWTDADGNTVLADGWRRLIMIRPKQAPPRSAIGLTHVGLDGVKVEIKGSAKELVHWRLDEEPWKVVSSRIFILENIPSGRHSISVFAMDKDLMLEDPPVKMEFLIDLDPAVQIERWISALSSTAYEKRKAAVASLGAQVTALTALKAARPKATDDLRWWIDAAIQEIEREEARRAKKNGAPPDDGAPLK